MLHRAQDSNMSIFFIESAMAFQRPESALKMKADSLDSAYPLWEKSRFRLFAARFEYLMENPRPELYEEGL